MSAVLGRLSPSRLFKKGPVGRSRSTAGGDKPPDGTQPLPRRRAARARAHVTPKTEGPVRSFFPQSARARATCPVRVRSGGLFPVTCQRPSDRHSPRGWGLPTSLTWKGRGRPLVARRGTARFWGCTVSKPEMPLSVHSIEVEWATRMAIVHKPYGGTPIRCSALAAADRT